MKLAHLKAAVRRTAISYREKSLISAAYKAPGTSPETKTLDRARCDLSSILVALDSRALNFSSLAVCLTFLFGPPCRREWSAPNLTALLPCRR